MRRIALLALFQLVFLAACGGSGSKSLLGSGSGSGSSTGGGSGNNIASPAANVVQMTVDAGPSGVNSFNIPYVTVTICAPGSTTNCQTIDHVEVDTASYGLRIIAAVLNPTLLAALPGETTTAGDPIAECVEFGDGYSWGSMHTADLQISSEKAAGIPMEVLGDSSLPAAPQPCVSGNMGGKEEDTVALFGANGIIGVGPFAQDCGTGCVQSDGGGTYYYSCPVSGSCTPTPVLLTQQAVNPVVAFTTDNNGVIVELPSVADGGAASVTGALVFGIGTQGNNSLGSATVLTTDSTNGNLTVTFNGSSYSEGFYDSGSNLIYFDFPTNSTSAITQCTIGNSTNNTNSQLFYCPSTEQTLTAVNTGLNGTQSTVTFNVANANTLLQTNFTAFENLAAPAGVTAQFDLGLPFFYGRNVFTAIQGMNTSGGMGPYIAY